MNSLPIRALWPLSSAPHAKGSWCPVPQFDLRLWITLYGHGGEDGSRSCPFLWNPFEIEDILADYRSKVLTCREHWIGDDQRHSVIWIACHSDCTQIGRQPAGRKSLICKNHKKKLVSMVRYFRHCYLDKRDVR
jgi:hypothetical protein